MDTVVVTTALTKRYGTRAVVDSVDLTVHRGQVFGFLGPNGAGKTTTLRMIAGQVRPSAGSVRVHGHPAGHPAALHRTGALIEAPGFYPYLSGRDDLRVAARYRALDESSADAALDVVGLADDARRPFRDYSLGMKQRLGVACALLGDPELLVLDEPTNGLDPAGVVEMRRLIADLAADGRTVLLSSHLLAEVQQVCDSVAVISNGRVVHDGTVASMRGAATLRLRVAPADGGREVVSRLAGHPVETGPAGPGAAVLSVPAADVDVPSVVRELVAAGIAVHEVTRTERSLEDVFLTMTGERR